MKNHFAKFRQGIIGIDADIPNPSGENHRLVYADWIASGRNFLPIEQRIQEELMPFVANTHTETSLTGMAMTHAYHSAHRLIKKHVNAAADDVIITAGSGMTAMVCKLQRLLGYQLNEKFGQMPTDHDRPVVFITHMEHHSNQTSWLETIAQVEIIKPTDDGLVDLNHFAELLDQFKDRPVKIASVTACSNVTGIKTPYHQIAQMIHRVGGYCFVDFACSAPYVAIDMHPAEEDAHLDAIFFSPHKFLGGPGASGVLIFNRKLYHRHVPDIPGGGTVDWTNPWGQHKYLDDIEAREDGGTPAFLQTIKAAMCITLKEEMGVERIKAREQHLLGLLWNKIEQIPGIHILADQHRDRLPIISFYMDDLHYHLGVRLLNDRFGIQCRGGCSCAGTYGHYLLNVSPEQSKAITDRISQGDYSAKPGWIRISLHPTMTEEEIEFIGDSLMELAVNHRKWSLDYDFNSSCSSLHAKTADWEEDLKERILDTLSRPFANSKRKSNKGIINKMPIGHA